MKRCVLRFLLGLCAFASLTTVAMAASPDEMAIAKFMNQDLAAGWKQNSPGKVLEFFSDSVPVVWFNADKQGPATMSKAERKKELEAFFKKVKVLDFNVGDIVVTKINDHMGFVSCTQKVLLVDKATNEENQLVMRNIYEVTKEKDGKWRATREIAFAADAGN